MRMVTVSEGDTLLQPGLEIRAITNCFFILVNRFGSLGKRFGYFDPFCQICLQFQSQLL